MPPEVVRIEIKDQVGDHLPCTDWPSVLSEGAGEFTETKTLLLDFVSNNNNKNKVVISYGIADAASWVLSLVGILPDVVLFEEWEFDIGIGRNHRVLVRPGLVDPS